MTATTTFPAAEVRTTKAPLVRTGAVAGVVAGAATAATAAIAHAAGVSLAVGGKAIPVVGFAQLTFVFSMLGAAIAVGLARFARRPRATFLRTTLVLTALSLVPDALADAHSGTRVLLACTHIVAAAIVIPALASRLGESSL